MGNAAIEPMTDDNVTVESGNDYERNNNNNNVSSPVVNFKNSIKSPNNNNNNEDEESPIQILLQFIPYYNQGNSANDSLVRSTLSGLSLEDIDTRDIYENTCLLLACQYKCEDLVRIMLTKGADPNAVNSSGACGLHFACYSDSSSRNIAKLLLVNGANPDIIENTFGCSPLHYCASTGDIEFCKLLLTYGAQVQAIDYYNYTCADYARDAGHVELYEFLSNKIKQWENQQNIRTISGSYNNNNNNNNSGYNLNQYTTPNKSMNSIDSFNTNTNNNDNQPAIPIDWQVNYDSNTQSRYYNNIRTGEVVWEQELLNRLTLEDKLKKTPASGNAIKMDVIPETPTNKLNKNLALINKASRARLIAFFSQHDPTRLTDIDDILNKYKGKEQDMLKELCTEYKVEENSEMVAFASKLEELTENENNINISTPVSLSSSFQLGKSTPISMRGTPNNIQSTPSNILNNNNNNNTGIAEATVLQQQQQQMLQRISILESQFDEERTNYRNMIAEKEGIISKLESSLEKIQKDKKELEIEKNELELNINKTLSTGGEALNASELKYIQLENDYDILKKQLEKTLSELSIEKEKLKSLESTITNLQSSEIDRIEQEKNAMEERAKIQRERDEKYAIELREVENNKRKLEIKLKNEISTIKLESETIEINLKKLHDQYKRTKETEIEIMNKEMSERKSEFAQKLSTAQLLAEEALKRAEIAETRQKLMESDVIEAQKVIQYNIQLHKDLGREQAARKRLHNEMEDMKGKIRVYVRIRPISNSELERGSIETVTKDGKLSVLIKQPDGKKNYDFDQVFGGLEGNNQTDIFRDTKHLMLSVIDGYNVCIFAYGQTGAGKSYTMIGAADIANCLQENGDFDSQAGITPRAVSELFRLLTERSAQVSYEIEVQMFQLYRDGIEDLLTVTSKEKDIGIKRKIKDDNHKIDTNGLKITLAEHSTTGLVYVEGAETYIAESPSDVMKIFAKGASHRTTSSTQMNAESSRSHLICSLTVKLTNRRTNVESVGKLTLVDLAGSERVDKSGASGDQLKEAQSINKSLSALGDVIAALTTGSKHIPYRNHPLTMLMSDSLGGNAKTLMFVNTSPADYNVPETISSLNFAIRCKDITNAVSTGPGVQAAQMVALKKELAKLKKGGGATINTIASSSKQNVLGAPGVGLSRPNVQNS